MNFLICSFFLRWLQVSLIPRPFLLPSKGLGTRLVAGLPLVWGTSPFTREKGSGNIAIPALCPCLECGHDQSDHSVVNRVHFSACIARKFYLPRALKTAKTVGYRATGDRELLISVQQAIFISDCFFAGLFTVTVTMED